MADTHPPPTWEDDLPPEWHEDDPGLSMLPPAPDGEDTVSAGKPIKPYDDEALAEIVAMRGWDLVWDSRSIALWARNKRGQWREMTDRDLGHLRIWASQHVHTAKPNGSIGRWKPPAEWFKTTLDAYSFEHEVDRFEVWLEALPAWDHVPRLDAMLTDVFGAENTALTRWASSTTLIGAVRRAKTPGAKLDEAPILYGPQGCGKSTIYRALLAEAQWYTDAVDLSAIKSKETWEATDGTVIVELAEMSGVRRADKEALKNWATKTFDKGRRAYGRLPENPPRRFVVFGTTNDPACLPYDSSGDRRWVVIECPGVSVKGSKSGESLVGPVEDWMDETVSTWDGTDYTRAEMLWAEALYRCVEANETGRLPRSLRAKQAARNANHQQDDDAVIHQIMGTKFDPDGLPIPEIMFKCGATKEGVVPSRSEVLRWGDALAALGWGEARRSIQGKQVRVRIPPPEFAWTDDTKGFML